MKIFIVQFFTCFLLLLIFNGLIQPIHMFTNETSEYNIKQAKLLRIGFNHVFWDFVNSNDLEPLKVSSSCIKSLNNVFNSMKKDNQWTFQMFDSSSRFIIDSTETGYYDFGNYDRCLSLQWINDETKESEFGQHCTISILPKISESEYSKNIFTRNKIVSHVTEAVFKIGFCIPSSCSHDDIQTIFSKAIDVYDWQYVKTDQCKIKTTLVESIMNAKRYQQLSLAFLTTIVVINLYATWLDWSVRSNGWTRHFSLIRNYNGLINPVSTSRMTFLTKFQLSVHSYTLFIHAIFWYFCCKGWGLFANSNNLMQNRNSFMVRAGIGDWFASMIFVYGSITRTMEYWKFTGPSTSLIPSFINMVIKMIGIIITLLPLVAFTFITPLFFDGPIMSIFSDYTAEACSRSFYANLLFIQNSYRPIIDMCLPQTWSVAVEFQILPVIILLVHLYKRSPKLAVIVNSLIVIAGFLYTCINAFMKDAHPHTLTRSFEESPVFFWFENVYLPTPMIVWLYTLPPLWTYFIMNKYEKSNPILMKFTKCNKLLAAFILTLHILPMIWVLLENHVYPPFLNFIYFFFSRLCTGAVFTFVFMCNSDSLREFFSHPLDKEIFNENNACINNNVEPIFEKEIKVVQTDEGNSIKVEKMPSEQKNRLLHICSTLWRSAYYVHMCMIILRYSIQRWPLNSVESYISIVIECLALSFFAAFFFHLFVVGPVTSLISTVKLRPQSKLKAK